MSEISDKDLRQALDRIARTPDGELLYLYLQKTLCAVTVLNPTTERALPRNEGRRSFAAELMGHMAEGLRTRGRTGNSIVTFALAGPRRADGADPEPRRSRGAGRRVTIADAVPGWDAPAESEPGRE